MAEIKVGNATKQIANNLYANSQMRAVDPAHWYMEIYGTLPVYNYFISIHRVDEDEDFDIYNVIFNDLMKTGDFTPLLYEYNKSRDRESRPHYVTEDIKKTNEIFSERYYMVSNNDPIMISYEYDGITVMSHQGTKIIDEFVEKYLKKYDQPDDNVKCYIIVKEPDFFLDNFNIELNGHLDFDLYNEGFETIHNSIVKSIVDDKNGLYLLYGKPGTGKSTYIRHLIETCGTDKRKFIYVPSSLFEDFTDPGILPFLLRNRGCVFIIEDCESLVTVDGGGRSEGITDLLNMTDGLLADALNIKIICTFNTDYEKIDEALLRPGRCRCKYEFTLLDKDRANKVAEKFNLQKVDNDVSLAELFNPEIAFKDEKKKKIGFRTK